MPRTVPVNPITGVQGRYIRDVEAECGGMFAAEDPMGDLWGAGKWYRHIPDEEFGRREHRPRTPAPVRRQGARA